MLFRSPEPAAAPVVSAGAAVSAALVAASVAAVVAGVLPEPPQAVADKATVTASTSASTFLFLIDFSSFLLLLT